MKYRLSFLFALLRRTIIATTKAERATETPSIIQAIFAVSFLVIGEPPEGYKQSLMLRTLTVIHIIEKVALMFTYHPGRLI